MSDNYPDPYDPGPWDNPSTVPPPPTWARTDLTGHLDGTHVAETPTLMPRTDGHCTLYRGRTHSFYGESESGKSLVAQAEVARCILAGEDVAFLDFESDAGSVVGRLLDMGVPAASLAEHLDYRTPEVRPTLDAQELVEWEGLLGHAYALVVIDGLTAALSLWGVETMDNDRYTAWARAVPQRIADLTGAAVVLVDHVVKNSDNRGRYAIGAQAKLSTLTGCAYLVEVAETLGRGLRGVVVLRVAKDRPGSIRPFCGPMRKADRTQEAARVVVDSRSAEVGMVVTIEPPTTVTGGAHADDEDAAAFRPSTLMQRLSEALALAGEAIATNELMRRTTGNRVARMEAVDILVAEGYVARMDAPNRGKNLRHVKAYVARLDPRSDDFHGEEPPDPPRDGFNGGLGGSVVPSLKGGKEGTTGNTPSVVPRNHRGTTEEPPADCALCGCSFVANGRGICPSCDRGRAAS